MSPLTSLDLHERALALLTAVHQRDALAKRRVEHGLTLLDIHLDADGLETHLMKHSFRHDFSTS